MRSCRLLIVVVVAGCSAGDGAGHSDRGSAEDSRSESTEATQPMPAAGCRPVAHAWDPATEPIRLPCARTVEACNGLDDDHDGLTDPHCPTTRCLSDADCTAGGLILDVDCNFNFDPPACTPIDGFPFHAEKADACRGVLCPPGLKCSQGECGAAGTALPDASCQSGWDCPLSAGCLPVERSGLTGARCVQYCQHTPCPDGFYCLGTWEQRGALWTWSMTCVGAVVCSAATTQCKELLDSCGADRRCVPLTDCLDEACFWPETASACNRACLDQVQSAPNLAPTIDCVRKACGP